MLYTRARTSDVSYRGRRRVSPCPYIVVGKPLLGTDVKSPIHELHEAAYWGRLGLTTISPSVYDACGCGSGRITLMIGGVEATSRWVLTAISAHPGRNWLTAISRFRKAFVGIEKPSFGFIHMLWGV